MPNVSVFDAAGKKVEDLALSEAIFGITPNVPAMHLMGGKLSGKPAPGHAVYPYAL